MEPSQRGVRLHRLVLAMVAVWRQWHRHRRACRVVGATPDVAALPFGLDCVLSRSPGKQRADERSGARGAPRGCKSTRRRTTTAVGARFQLDEARGQREAEQERVQQAAQHARAEEATAATRVLQISR